MATAPTPPPQKPPASSGSYYCILMRAAAGSDRSLQDIWHWAEAQALILERHAANLIGGQELRFIPAPVLPPFDAIDLGTLTPTGPAGAFEHRLPFSSQRSPAAGRCTSPSTFSALWVKESTRRTAAASVWTGRGPPTIGPGATSSWPKKSASTASTS